MSKELENFLAPPAEIPWDSAAAFFMATKEATMDKSAAAPLKDRADELDKAKSRGVIGGIRSSIHQDITHATRVRRTRGARVGKEVGTLSGAAGGYLAGRKGGVAGKIGGTALGALIGRGAGKSLGEEIDRRRTLSRYSRPNQKKAEIEKRSEVQYVRSLWKQAQGVAPAESVGGPEGATPAPGPVDMAGMSQEEAAAAGASQAGPRVLAPSGAPTPEELAQAQAMAQLEQELMADQEAEQNAADYYKQLAEQAGGELQQTQAQLQETQQAAEQANQQAQMSQQQADMATQQLQQQSQADAAEKEQLNEAALTAKQQIMQMRQAMTAYRENLQQIALQDPTAAAGPSPEEQGMPPAGEEAPPEGAPAEGEQAPPMSGKAAKQAQEAQQAQGEAAKQTQQAEQAAQEDQSKQQQAQEQAVMAQQQAAIAQQQASMGKQSSVIPELLQEKLGSDRAWGAAIGALGGGSFQALLDRKGSGGMSEKEKVLRTKLQHLQGKPNKSAFDKHMVNMTRALADTAKVNREHPGSAAAMAAMTGAVAGAALGPTVRSMMRR